MSEYRWQGHTHQELFEQINQGPGAAGATDPVRRWRELTQALGEIDAGLATALTRAMGDWEGDAADNARNGLRPLGNWAVEAQQAAEIMRDRVEQQAEFVGKARNDMPPPVAVTAEKPGPGASMLVHLFGGQSDYEVQEAEQHAAEQRAFEVMRTYESSTSTNTTSLASFAPPPQVVVDTPPPTGGTASGQQGVTLSWSTTPPTTHAPNNAISRWMRATTGGSTGAPRTPTTGSGGAGNAARGNPTSGGSGSAASSARGQPSGTGSSIAPSSGSTGGGSRRSETESEPDQIDHAVTEQVGDSGGFFDEPRTLSRPVIGGETD